MTRTKAKKKTTRVKYPRVEFPPELLPQLKAVAVTAGETLPRALTRLLGPVLDVEFRQLANSKPHKNGD